MKKNKKTKIIIGVVGAGLLVAGFCYVGWNSYEYGINSILRDIRDNGFRVVNKAGNEMGFRMTRKTLFGGEKVVASL